MVVSDILSKVIIDKKDSKNLIEASDLRVFICRKSGTRWVPESVIFRLSKISSEELNRIGLLSLESFEFNSELNTLMLCISDKSMPTGSMNSINHLGAEFFSCFDEETKFVVAAYKDGNLIEKSAGGFDFAGVVVKSYSSYFMKSPDHILNFDWVVISGNYVLLTLKAIRGVVE